MRTLIRRAALALVVTLATLLSPQVGAQPDLESCDSPDASIPDLAILTETQTVSDDLTIGELEVAVDITHPFIGSLEVMLETPESTAVRLMKNVGYSFDDALVTFSDFGIPHDDDLTCECLMRPRGPQNLSDALGESTMGDWTLTIEDARSGETGTLNEWCVRVNEDVPVYPILDLLGRPTDTEGVCELTWTHPIDYDEIDVTINGVFEETLDGPFIAGDENSYTIPELVVPQAPAVICLTPRVGTTDGPEACVSVQLPVLFDVFVCSVAPVAIEGVTAFESIDASNLVTVTEESYVQELEVLVDATVPFNSWQMDLESPSGLSVALYDGRVQGADIHVIFTDDGAAPGSATLASSARLEPTGPGFLGDFNAEPTNGDWNLRIITYSNGRLDNWCLNIRDCNIERPTDLICSETDSAVELTWINLSTYDSIEVFANGERVETIDGADESYVDVDPSAGRRRYHLVAHSETLDCALSSQPCLASPGLSEACDTVSRDVTWYINRLDLEVTETDTIGDYFDAFVLLDTDNDETYAWDLRLTSPSGTTVLLHDNEGLSRDFDVYFTDDGEPSDATNQRLGRGHLVAPVGPGAMSDFHGENVVGSWLLEVETFVTGSVDEWCVGWSPSCSDSAPTEPTCTVTDFEVTLDWINGDVYDDVSVFRNNALIASLDGDVESFVDLPLAGSHLYRVSARIDDCVLSSSSCSVETMLSEICDDTDVFMTGSDAATIVELTVASSFTVQDVELAVTFDSRIDRLTLTTPSGTSITLVDGEEFVDGVFSDHVNLADFERREYSDCAGCRLGPAPGFAMGDLRGEDSEGDWSLAVTTLSGATLESVCLRLFEKCELDEPSGLNCEVVDDGVDLDWTNQATYDTVEIYRVPDQHAKEGHLARDLSVDALLAIVDGGETSFTDADVERGTHRYFLKVISASEECTSVSGQCRVVVGRVDVCDEPDAFVAGDATAEEFTVSFPADASLLIEDTEVTVDITTSFTDAFVELESPAGAIVTLHQYGGGATNFDVTYSDAGRAADKVAHYDCGGCPVKPAQEAMADFAGETADGEWLLTFLSFYDSTINSWCVGVYPEESSEPTFLRGDINGDGTVTALLDALSLLEYGFVGGAVPSCMDSADVDDSGVVSPLLDALFLLEWMFLGTDAPPDPGPDECGVDPTDDVTSCLDGC